VRKALTLTVRQDKADQTLRSFFEPFLLHKAIVPLPFTELGRFDKFSDQNRDKNQLVDIWRQARLLHNRTVNHERRLSYA